MSKTSEIDNLIATYDDWRGQRLSQIRDLIRQADPEVVEEVKWKTPSNPAGVALWSHDGMITTGEVYKKHLRLAFAKGPELDDPKGFINSYRAMIVHEEDELDENAFKNLIKEAVALNQSAKKK